MMIIPFSLLCYLCYYFQISISLKPIAIIFIIFIILIYYLYNSIKKEVILVEDDKIIMKHISTIITVSIFCLMGLMFYPIFYPILNEIALFKQTIYLPFIEIHYVLPLKWKIAYFGEILKQVCRQIDLQHPGFSQQILNSYDVTELQHSDKHQIIERAYQYAKQEYDKLQTIPLSENNKKEVLHFILGSILLIYVIIKADSIIENIFNQ